MSDYYPPSPLLSGASVDQTARDAAAAAQATANAALPNTDVAVSARLQTAGVAPTGGLGTGQVARTEADRAWDMDAVTSAFMSPAKQTEVLRTRGLGQDVTAEAQAAINYCIVNNRKLLVRGLHSISDTLVVQPQGGAQYAQCWIEGEGHGYDLSAGKGASRSPSGFVISVKDRPAISLNSMRGGYVGKLGLLGGNTAPGGSVDPNSDASTYLASGVVDGRYGGHAGIAIDDRTGAAPGGGNNVAGATYLNGSFSANIRIDRVYINQFACGIQHSPAIDGVQGDDIVVINPIIARCNIGIASGQSQTRGFHIISPYFQFCRIMFDCRTYGRQQGAIAKVSGGQAIWSYAVFNLPTGFQTFVLDGFYAETIRTLGIAGSGTATQRYPARLQGCHFKFGYNAGSNWKPEPLMLGEYFHPVTFDACTFHNACPTVSDAFNMFGTEIEADIINCTFQQTADIAKICVAVQIDYTTQMRSKLSGCYLKKASSDLVVSDVGKRRLTLPARLPLTYGSETVRDGLKQYDIVKNINNSYITPPNTTGTYAFSITGETGTLTFLGTGADFVVGDYLFWRVNSGLSIQTPIIPALVVTAVSGAGAGATITCSLMFNPARYDQTYAPASIVIFVENWAPGAALTGDTHTNTTLDNVSPTTILRNGDLVTGAGFAAKTRVASGGGTATITLTRATTATATGVRLYNDRATPVTYDAANAI